MATVGVEALTGAIIINGAVNPSWLGSFCALTIEAANDVPYVPSQPPSVAMVTVRFLANASIVSITLDVNIRDFERLASNETCLREIERLLDVDIIVADTLPSVISPDTRTEVLWCVLRFSYAPFFVHS